MSAQELRPMANPLVGQVVQLTTKEETLLVEAQDLAN